MTVTITATIRSLVKVLPEYWAPQVQDREVASKQGHGINPPGFGTAGSPFAGADAGPAHLRYSRRARRVIGPRTRTYGTTAQTTATISTWPG